MDWVHFTILAICNQLVLTFLSLLMCLDAPALTDVIQAKSCYLKN